jgi:ribosomal protein S18 acetylase RimI-like enzyme
MTLEIRDARASDEAEWRRLWNGYLTFYEVDLAAEVTAGTWRRIMDPASPVGMRVAGRDGTLVGFAIHLTHPSTWVATEDCYLEDLYVDEACRGGGVGRALLDDLVALGEARGWARLYWHTEEGNVRARRLYDSYVKAGDYVRYRMKLPRR